MTKRNKEIKAQPDENVSGIAQAGVGQKRSIKVASSYSLWVHPRQSMKYT